MTSNSSEFDACASGYDCALHRGLSVTGENREFFARGRVLWLAGLLRRQGVRPLSVLDYGCGTGTGTHYLGLILEPKSVLGVDVSVECLKVARSTWGEGQLSFLSTEAFQPEAQFDLAFCNGVFHHIPVGLRMDALAYIHRSLRPGGIFSFWENNPWNPATRLVMSRIPFDRDAITLSSVEAKRLVKRAGFGVLRTDFIFIFPRLLAWMRRLEPWLCKLPFGAQYQVMCRKTVSVNA